MALAITRFTWGTSDKMRIQIDIIDHIHSLMSPWFSLWRLLLCNLCANKEEKTKLDSMARKLHLSTVETEKLSSFINIPIIDINIESSSSDISMGGVIKMVVLKNSGQEAQLENTILRLKNAIGKSNNTLYDVLTRKILLLCTFGSEPSKFELKMTPEMLAEMEEFYK